MPQSVFWQFAVSAVQFSIWLFGGAGCKFGCCRRVQSSLRSTTTVVEKMHLLGNNTCSALTATRPEIKTPIKKRKNAFSHFHYKGTFMGRDVTYASWKEHFLYIADYYPSSSGWALRHWGEGGKEEHYRRLSFPLSRRERRLSYRPTYDPKKKLIFYLEKILREKEVLACFYKGFLRKKWHLFFKKNEKIEAGYLFLQHFFSLAPSLEKKKKKSFSFYHVFTPLTQIFYQNLFSPPSSSPRPLQGGGGDQQFSGVPMSSLHRVSVLIVNFAFFKSTCT